MKLCINTFILKILYGLPCFGWAKIDRQTDDRRKRFKENPDNANSLSVSISLLFHNEFFISNQLKDNYRLKSILFVSFAIIKTLYNLFSDLI